MKLTIKESYTYSDDFTERLQEELWTTTDVEKLRKVLTRKGFMLDKSDSIDYNLGRRRNADDMSFDTWKKEETHEGDDIIVKVYYSDDYEVIDIHVWKEADEDLD